LQPLGAQCGANPRTQFRRFKRFGQVIRRAEFEAAHLVTRGVPRGEHDHRDVLRLRRLAQLL
jgi:hypothetical protein